MTNTAIHWDDPRHPGLRWAIDLHEPDTVEVDGETWHDCRDPDCPGWYRNTEHPAKHYHRE